VWEECAEVPECESLDITADCPTCKDDAAKNKTVCFSDDGRFCGKCADGYCDIAGEGKKINESSCCGGEKTDSAKCCVQDEFKVEGTYKQVDKNRSIASLGISKYEVCTNR
jgi:hypothetical protein